MTMFALALGAFILLHVGLAATPLRAGLIKAIGAGPYRGLFSLASVAVFAWMVWAFAGAEADPANAMLWTPPAWGRHVTATLVLAGFLLGVTGLLTPGPTLVGFEGMLNKPDAAKGVLRITRHPFLWGVALWGAGHLFSNGQLASVLLFAGLAAMVLRGTRSIDAKTAAGNPTGWAAFSAVTSNIPFAAIAQGRNRLALGEVAPRLVVALIAFAAFAYFHRIVIGVPAFDFGA